MQYLPSITAVDEDGVPNHNTVADAHSAFQLFEKGNKQIKFGIILRNQSKFKVSNTTKCKNLVY